MGSVPFSREQVYYGKSILPVFQAVNGTVSSVSCLQGTCVGSAPYSKEHVLSSEIRLQEERDLPKAVASPVLQRITRCWKSLATAHTLPISGRQDPGWVGERVTDQASWNPDLVKSVLMRAESRAPNYFITADANLDAADPVAGIAVIEAGSLFSDGRRGKVFSGDRASKGVNNSDAVIDAVTAGSGVAVIGLTVDPDAISSDLERPVQKGVSPSLANNGYDDNGYLPSSGSFHRDSEDDITTGAIRVAADQVTTEWSMEYQDVQGCFLMHELVYILGSLQA